MKKFNDTVITVRFRLETLEKVHLFSKMASLLMPEISQTSLWQEKLKIILIIPYGNNVPKVKKNKYNRSYRIGMWYVIYRRTWV